MQPWLDTAPKPPPPPFPSVLKTWVPGGMVSICYAQVPIDDGNKCTLTLGEGGHILPCVADYRGMIIVTDEEEGEARSGGCGIVDENNTKLPANQENRP